MKGKQILLGCMALVLLSGCGGRKEEVFRQAEADLENGAFETALLGYKASAAAEVHSAQAYRGAGIAYLNLGQYEEAITSFDNALSYDRLSDDARRDILQYKAVTYYKAEQYEKAMETCQELMEYQMDVQSYYLTGRVALAMDSYDEAAKNFQNAYAEDASYETAIQIYEAYFEKGMQADGIGYLEMSLNKPPSDAQDYCDRGQIYLLMEEYDNARQELTEAVNKGSAEAVLLMGRAYLAQNDIANARSMYQQYVTEHEETSARGYNGLALCDIAEGNYESAGNNLSLGLQRATEEEKRELLFNQVVVYEKMLDFSTAYEKVSEYLQMFPEDEEAGKERTFLASRIGQSGQSAGQENQSEETEQNTVYTEDPAQEG
ncbi:MAG: tetratricopeptide repeat protein [Eubacteriales bacterium]|nr:tetratricopeptide repeat protein [Eubacteriales bacterium]